MGLFDKLKSKKQQSNVAESVSEEEKQYYAEDDYYKKTAFEGTAFEREVITFDEWKKRSYPSKNDLYVPEVLLLQYCEYGNYPHPANGYPGLWWYQYGIRDVTAALKQLEDRGFICFGSPSASLQRLKVAELKDLLTKKGCSVNGKKADLIESVSENYTDQELVDNGIESKYILTLLGEKELQDNKYIPFMHSLNGTTVVGCENEFNVWSINRALKGTETDNWKDVVISEYKRTHDNLSLLNQLLEQLERV